MPNPLIENKIKEVMDIHKNSVSKEEILTAFKTIVDIVKQVKQSNFDNSQKLEKQYNEVFNRLLRDIKNSPLYTELQQTTKTDALLSVEELKGSTKQTIAGEIEGLSNREKELLKTLDIKLSDIKKSSMPDIKKIINDSSLGAREALTPILLGSIKKEIKTFYDKLQDKEIKDLKKEIKNLREDLQMKVAMGGVATQGMTTRVKDISDDLDGVTKTFSLPTFWRITGVWSSSAPNALRPVIDYTVSGSAITFTDEINAGTVLASGQTMIIQYLATA